MGRIIPGPVAGGGGGVTDHGALTGLGDVADHPDFLLIDGSRASTGQQTFGAGVLIGGNLASDIFLAADAISASDLALATAGYVDANYGSLADLAAVLAAIITDHGGLGGLGDDDHTIYLLASGARAVAGSMEFTVGFELGGNAITDSLLAADAVSSSDAALATAGYLSSKYAAKSVENEYTASQRSHVVTLTDAANVAIDASLSNIYELLITVLVGATRQLDNPSNLAKGMTWQVWVSQAAGGGGRGITFGTQYDWGDEGAPNLTGQGAGITTVLSFVALSTTQIACTALRGFA